MADQALRTKRAWFQHKLKEVARKKNVAIDAVAWRDEITHEASQLTVESKGKTKTFSLNDFGLTGLPPRELEEWVEQIVDSFH